MYGLQPGPRLFQENPQLVWTVIASMYVGNVILLVLNLPLVGVWARIATIPFPILGPIILLSAVIGAYSIRYLLFDVWMAILFGIIGYALRKTGYPLAPIALACVLGPTLETSLKQSLILSGGSLTIFATRPLTAGHPARHVRDGRAHVVGASQRSGAAPCDRRVVPRITRIPLMACEMPSRRLSQSSTLEAAAEEEPAQGRSVICDYIMLQLWSHQARVHHANNRRSGTEIELEQVSEAGRGG